MSRVDSNHDSVASNTSLQHHCSLSRSAIGTVHEGSLARHQLQRELEQLDEASLQREVQAALLRVNSSRYCDTPYARRQLGFVGSELPSATVTPRCCICGSDNLLPPLHSCSLRRHVHCHACVNALGGKHACTVCVPRPDNVNSFTSAHTRGLHHADSHLEISKADAVLVIDERHPAGLRSERTGHDCGAVARIESCVDPACRDLALELQVTRL